MIIFELLGELFIVLFLVFLNGFFVAAEFAIVKVRSTQIDPLVTKGNFRARIAKEIITHLDAYLSATQLGITISSLALGWIGEPYVAGLLRPTLESVNIGDQRIVEWISFAIAFSFITFLHIVLGELTPKSLAIQKAQMTTLWIAYPLRLFYLVFKPIIRMLNGLANAILRLIGIQAVSESELMHSEEELRLLLSQKKEISTTSKQIVMNAMDFRKKQARHCMVPRTEMIALSLRETTEKNLEIIRSQKFSRFPVFKDSIDNIVGIVHTKDIFKPERDHKPGFILEWVVRDALFLPETVSLEKVLEVILLKKVHMIILADEYGGTAGLLTLENVIEELVGSIQDEYDRETPEITKIQEDEYLVDASITTNDIERLIEREISIRDIQSIGGFVIEHLGHLPAIGEQVEIPGVRFIVEKVDDRVVETLRVIKLPFPTEENEEQEQ